MESILGWTVAPAFPQKRTSPVVVFLEEHARGREHPSPTSRHQVEAVALQPQGPSGVHCPLLDKKRLSALEVRHRGSHLLDQLQ